MCSRTSVATPRLLGFFTASDSLRPRILYQPPTLHSAYTPCSICIHFNLTIEHIYNLSSICIYISASLFINWRSCLERERFNLLFQIFVCENKPEYLLGNLISKCSVFKQIIQGDFNCGEKKYSKRNHKEECMGCFVFRHGVLGA